MSFLGLILKNLGRQKTRAGLTLLGITVGITTVVALGVITEGFKAASAGIITSRGSDMIVAQKGASDLSFSTIQETETANVRQVAGVERASGSLFHITTVRSNPFFFLTGVLPGDLASNPPEMQAGRVPMDSDQPEILLGEGAADDLDAVPGEHVTIDNRDFLVVGVYHSGAVFENNGAFVPLRVAQEMTSKQGAVSVIHVKVAAGYSVPDVAKSIEAALPNLVTISNVGEYGKVDQGVTILDAANLAISLLAVGIGAVGVMNTMVMSVFERTREIGILRAVGWSGFRVLRMIVTESLVLCGAAAVIGTLVGVAASELVVLVPAIERLLEPQYSAAIFVRAIGVGFVVALVGAAYPAYRAVRLTPLEALRYE
jgi:putative ABC transport system permease protein